MRTPPLTEAEQEPHYRDLHFALIQAMQVYQLKTGWRITSLSFTATAGTTELKVAISSKPSQ
jgi:hypothetical protein